MDASDTRVIGADWCNYTNIIRLYWPIRSIDAAKVVLNVVMLQHDCTKMVIHYAKHVHLSIVGNFIYSYCALLYFENKLCYTLIYANDLMACFNLVQMLVSYSHLPIATEFLVCKM